MIFRKIFNRKNYINALLNINFVCFSPQFPDFTKPETMTMLYEQQLSPSSTWETPQNEDIYSIELLTPQSSPLNEELNESENTIDLPIHDHLTKPVQFSQDFGGLAFETEIDHIVRSCPGNEESSVDLNYIDDSNSSQQSLQKNLVQDRMLFTFDDDLRLPITWASPLDVENKRKDLETPQVGSRWIFPAVQTNNNSYNMPISPLSNNEDENINETLEEKGFEEGDTAANIEDEEEALLKNGLQQLISIKEEIEDSHIAYPASEMQQPADTTPVLRRSSRRRKLRVDIEKAQQDEEVNSLDTPDILNDIVDMEYTSNFDIVEFVDGATEVNFIYILYEHHFPSTVDITEIPLDIRSIFTFTIELLACNFD